MLLGLGLHDHSNHPHVGEEGNSWEDLVGAMGRERPLLSPHSIATRLSSAEKDEMLLALKRGTGLDEDTPINAVEVDSRTLLGSEGQAFASGPMRSFFYTKKLTPSVAAHELGHIKSWETPYGKATALGRNFGGPLSAALLLASGMVSKSKKGKALGYGGAALASVLPSASEYAQEVDAWKYGDRALDEYNKDSLLYTDELRERASKTKEKALNTYAVTGKHETMRNLVKGGLGGLGLGALARTFLGDKGNRRLKRGTAIWALGGPALLSAYMASLPGDEEMIDTVVGATSDHPWVDYNVTKLAYAYGSLKAKEKNLGN